MFFFLLITEATPEWVTPGKQKCPHMLKDVQCLGHVLLLALPWLWGAALVRMMLQAVLGVTSGGQKRSQHISQLTSLLLAC